MHLLKCSKNKKSKIEKKHNILSKYKEIIDKIHKFNQRTKNSRANQQPKISTLAKLKFIKILAGLRTTKGIYIK